MQASALTVRRDIADAESGLFASCQGGRSCANLGTVRYSANDLDVEDAARELHVPPTVVHAAILAGDLAAYNRGNHIEIRPADLAAYRLRIRPNRV